MEVPWFKQKKKNTKNRKEKKQEINQKQKDNMQAKPPVLQQSLSQQNSNILGHGHLQQSQGIHVSTASQSIN